MFDKNINPTHRMQVYLNNKWKWVPVVVTWEDEEEYTISGSTDKFFKQINALNLNTNKEEVK